MPLWFSPFPLEPTLQERLERCGWQRCQENELPSDALILYAAPDQLLAFSELDPAGILEGYQQLLGLEYPHRLLSTWRLAACSDALLQVGCAVDADTDLEWPELEGWPEPQPLAAVITRLALDALPALLDAYLDLELEADLLSGEPDSHYRRRLLSQLSFGGLLQAWRSPSALAGELEALKQEHEQALALAQLETTEAREEAELTLLQLHQVQEELEHYFLQATEQAKQLETLKQEHEQVLAQLQQARDEQANRASLLEAELATLRSDQEGAVERAQLETTEAREEAELTLLQLHQVQEELEHYFLQATEQAKQLETLKQEHEQVLAQLQQARDEQANRASLLEAELATLRSDQEGAVERAQLETTEAREEAELTLLQLHQVQEELEHYFLLSRGQAQQLERYEALLRRSEGLLSAAAR